MTTPSRFQSFGWLSHPRSTRQLISRLLQMTDNPPKISSIDAHPRTKATTKPWGSAYTTRQYPRSLWSHINLPSHMYPTTAAPADGRGDTPLYPRAADGRPRNTMRCHTAKPIHKPAQGAPADKACVALIGRRRTNTCQQRIQHQWP